MKGRYDDQLKARDLRSRGYTINEICEAVGASKGSVSGWVKGVEIIGQSRLRLKKKQATFKNTERLKAGVEVWSNQCAAQREVWREEGRQKARLNDRAHAMACGLYWAEGEKSRNTFCFANSDAGMMSLMADFLRANFEVSHEDLKARVYFYDNSGLTVEGVEKHWGDVIDKRGIKWQKHCVNPYNKNRVSDDQRKNHVNRLPFGVCHLRVTGATRIVQHIFGAIEVYSGGKTVIDP